MSDSTKSEIARLEREIAQTRAVINQSRFPHLMEKEIAYVLHLNREIASIILNKNAPGSAA